MQRVDVLRQRKRVRRGRDPRVLVQPVQPQVPEPRGARRVRNGAGCARRGRPAHVRRAAGQGRGAVRGGHRAARDGSRGDVRDVSHRGRRELQGRPRRGRHGTPRGLRRGVLRGVCGSRAVQHVGVLPLRGGVRRRRGLPVQAPRVLAQVDGAGPRRAEPRARVGEGRRHPMDVRRRQPNAVLGGRAGARAGRDPRGRSHTHRNARGRRPGAGRNAGADARAGADVRRIRGENSRAVLRPASRPGGEPRGRRRARVLRRHLRHERSTVLLRRGRPRRARTAG